MSAPTNVYSRHSASAAHAEDVEDIIYNISPMDTYFLSNIEKSKADAVTHEWQTDVLTAADTANARIEGDDFSAQAVADVTRLKNYTQIFRKEVVVSGTQQRVSQYGKSTEMAYQMAKKAKEIKRDVEIVLLHNHDATTGAAASARAMAGVETWIYDTAHIAATGQTTSTTTAPASGIANAAATDGSSTALVEADLQTALATAWGNGGEIDVIMVGSVLKRKLATFTGLATRFRDVGAGQQAQIIGAVDVYVSDYGNHKIVLSRYCRSTSLLCLDMSLWGIAYLRPFQQFDIAKAGDSEKKMLLCEATLVAKQPTGNAKVTGVV
jgi:hypothetical protein